MGRMAGIFAWIAVWVFTLNWSTHAAQPLLRIGQQRVDASFLGCTNENLLEFQIANQSHFVSLHDLVRWSNPQSNEDRHEAILTDGSRLVLAESWAGKKAFQVSKEKVTLRTKSFGKIVLPRTKLQAFLLNAPKNHSLRVRLRDQTTQQKKTDHLWLTNGDTLTGQLLEIGHSSPAIQFSLDSTNKPISFPIDRVAALALGSRAEPPAKGNLAIGWCDGSYLVAETLAAEKKAAKIKLACAAELTADDLSEVVYLQSLMPQAVYLSDLEATEYRHQSFLDIPWPYRRDRNLQGGPLSASRRIYAKGLAMHTASRITYEIPRQRTPRPRRFVAQCAIDDSADGRGSVVFQVFLRQKGQLQLAFASPIVRGGEAPVPISVELAEAEQIVLVVEYADRGDQSDYANWLDARLE